jgi:ABC-2 type transport system permease protein
MLGRAMMIARKEMRESFRSRIIKMNFIVPAVIFGVLFPLIFGLIAGVAFSQMPTSSFSSFPFSAGPDFFPEITNQNQIVYLTLIYLFVGIFLLILPLLLPVYIAADSFAGEKERKTLQQLLQTPLSDSEILLGKMLTSFIPTMVTTYLCVLSTTIILNFSWLYIFGYFKFIFPNLAGLVQILLLYPALSFFTILTMSWISMRVNRVLEATQTGGVVILPMLVILFGSMFGVLPVQRFSFVLIMAGVFWLVDYGLFRLASKKFNREAILSRQ